MKFARFLAHISLRSIRTQRVDVDPLTAIVSYLRAAADGAEKEALVQVCLTVIALGDEIHDAHAAALSGYAAQLVDRFADCRLSLQYGPDELVEIAATLKGYADAV